MKMQILHRGSIPPKNRVNRANEIKSMAKNKPKSSHINFLFPTEDEKSEHFYLNNSQLILNQIRSPRVHESTFLYNFTFLNIFLPGLAEGWNRS